jgi:N-acylneuraminate cytidylyltransferase
VILAVVPARGGSRRVPRKNVRPFLGRPMIARAIDIARTSGVFDRIVVSTDDDEIAAMAAAAGADVPFRRPAALADDHAPTRPVVAHAIEALGAADAEAVCCLYATAPLVDPEDVRRGLARLRDSEASYVFPVAPFPSPIQRALRRAADGRVEMFDPAAFHARSQDLEPAWHDAGQFYWARPATWRSDAPIFGPGAIGLTVAPERVQDIDTEDDWRLAEMKARLLGLDGAASR